VESGVVESGEFRIVRSHRYVVVPGIIARASHISGAFQDFKQDLAIAAT